MKFRKGYVPWNKGLKGFRKGCKGHNFRGNPKRPDIESRRKMSESRIRFYKNGGKPWNFGRRSPIEHKPSFEQRRSQVYNDWRIKVFERDNFTCQICWNRGCYLEAHHIKSFAQYPELRFDVENGVTLCLPCHMLVDKNRRKFNGYK